jgi:hypothetical protein
VWFSASTYQFYSDDLIVRRCCTFTIDARKARRLRGRRSR